MSDQFVAEIRLFPFDFAPLDWAMCNGQLLPISQNTALFSLLGTFYGGNGTSNFALPNLQGRVPVHQGQGIGLSPYTLGQEGGSTAITLVTSEMPEHTHGVMCAASTGNAAVPTENSFGAALRGKPPGYGGTGGTAVAMSSAAVANSGGGQPHDNMQPYLALNYCIALYGIYPARS